MNISDSKPFMIFRREYNGRVFYSVGLSKKDRNGNYQNGYMTCQFPNNVSLEDKTKIYIKSAWVTFYLKDKETKPYIFINDFEKVTETIEKAKEKDPFEEYGEEIIGADDYLPF